MTILKSRGFLLLLLLFVSSSLSKKVKGQGGLNKGKRVDNGESIDSWIKFELDEKGGEVHKRAETSQHLQTLVDFYKDLVSALDKVEAILRYDVLGILSEAVETHSSRLEQIISRLELYLGEMRDGGYDSDAEYEKFMASIQEDMTVLREESEKLASKMEKLHAEDKTIVNKEEVIGLLTKIKGKVNDFERSVAILDFYGIPLQAEVKHDKMDKVNKPAAPSSKKFEISYLTKLQGMYAKIEAFESSTKKYKYLSAKETVEGAEASSHNFEPMSDIEKLEKLEILAKQFVKRKLKILRKFVPTVNGIKNSIITLVPKTEEAHNKIADQTITKALGAVEVEKKIETLISSIQDAREARREEGDEIHAEL